MIKSIVKLFVLPISIAACFFSCASTKVVWIPVYEINGGGERNACSYDPVQHTIINPSENIMYAYFKAEKSGHIVFANKYSVSFSEKVTYNQKNGSMEIDNSASTKQKVSYLSLQKSFYYALSEDQTEKEGTDLFYVKNDHLINFNNAKLTDGRLVTYDILGASLGTSPLETVTVIDVLPPAFQYASSEFWFKNNNGVFKHKLVKQDGKNALVFDADLKEKLKPGESFIIRVNVKIQKDQMEKIFN